MATEVLADERTLRDVRRARALAQMEAYGIDVLVLGREANARYVSGAPRLWTAGTRPFGPGCIVVRSTGAIHLLSTWDEGIPEEIPHENLFGITWNPGNLLAWLRGIEGTAGARVVATDSLTPRFAQLLPRVFLSAELVDAEPALRAARRVKTPEEVDAIRSAVSVAENSLAMAVEALRPGVREREIAGVFMDAMARQGVTTPATQRVCWITSSERSNGKRRDDRVRAEDLVAFDAGVVEAGYTGESGRTWPADPTTVDARTREFYLRADELLSRLLAACKPGASCMSLLDAYEATGESLPKSPIAWGLGLGFDVPVVARQLPKTADTECLEPGMVLAVVAQVADDGVPAVFHKEAVLITEDGHELLTSGPRWRP